MNERTHDCIEKRACIVCSKTFEAAPMAADLTPEATVRVDGDPMPWGLCPEHEQLYESGVVAIVEVDFGPRGPSGALLEFPNLKDLIRTGRVLHLPQEVLGEILNLPLKLMPPCVFVPAGIFDHFSPRSVGAH
jgi:hypothetical protein